MSRSVSTHPNSVEDVFLHGITFEVSFFGLPGYTPGDDDDLPSPDYFEWAEYINDLREVIRERYPSFENADRWCNYPHGENHVVLENGAAEVSVAEYNGLISVSLAPKEGDDTHGYAFETARCATWTSRISRNFVKHLHKRFGKFAVLYSGSASNGEAFFRPLDRPNGLVTSKEGELW